MKEFVHVVTLPDDKILVQFRFDVRGNHLISCGIRGSFCVEDFGSFPIAVAKILLDSKAISADLSMSRGLWRANEWGSYPPLLNLIPSPSGSLLHAEFNYMAPKLEDATSNSKQQSSSSTPVREVASSQVKSLQEDTTRLVDEKVGDFSMGYRWRLMRSLMSGTFCAALNQNTAMSSPFRLFPSRDKSSTSGHQIAQYFSGESVCTENIDAWLKLIPYQPAQQVSGISKSFTGNTSTVSESSSDRTALKHLIWRDWLLHSPWHSLTFEANASSPRATHRGNSKSLLKGRRNKRELSMTLTVSAVLLPKLLSVHADLLTALKEKGYSATLDKNVLEKRTELREDKGNRSAPLDVIDRIVLRRYVRDSRERDFYVEMIVDGAFSERGNFPKSIDNNAAITGDKSGNSNGGGSTVVSVMELLPPFYDIKLNTYKYSVHCPSRSTSTSTTRSPSTHFAADLPSFLYTPKAYKDSDCFPQYQDHLAYLESNTTSSSSSLSKSRSGLEIENDEKGDRNRNRNRNKSNVKSEQSQECFGSITWTLDLPHGCSIRSVYRAEKRHMHREQHASDASRGLVVPPAIVTLRDKRNCSIGGTAQGMKGGRERMLISDPALITFPIPDASMPFNIITLVCTVMAFFLGSLINTLVRTKKKTLKPKIT